MIVKNALTQEPVALVKPLAAGYQLCWYGVTEYGHLGYWNVAGEDYHKFAEQILLRLARQELVIEHEDGGLA